MNVLFVCSANKLRSKTADDYFSENRKDHSFRSAGTNKRYCEAEGTTFLEEEMLDWADVVLVMEEKHRKIIREYSNGNNMHKVKVLGIPDDFKYMQKELIDILLDKTKDII